MRRHLRHARRTRARSFRAPARASVRVRRPSSSARAALGSSPSSAPSAPPRAAGRYGNESGRSRLFRQSRAAGQLLLLIDGFDEAKNRSAVSECLATAVRENIFIVVSSRSNAMDALTATGFTIVAVQPLSIAHVNSLVERRVAVPASREWIKRELQRREYRSIGTSPLMRECAKHGAAALLALRCFVV